MAATIIYLIKPIGIDYGHDYNFVGEKPQLGVYIAKNSKELERVEADLRSRGFREFKIDVIRLDSLRYIPLYLR